MQMEDNELFQITKLLAHYIHALMSCDIVKLPATMNSQSSQIQLPHEDDEYEEYYYEVRHPLPKGAFLLIQYDLRLQKTAVSLMSALIGPSRVVNVYYCIGDISSKRKYSEFDGGKCFHDYTAVDLLGKVHINRCFDFHRGFWVDSVPRANYINYYLHGLVGRYHDDTEWGDAFDWNTRHEDFDSVIPLNKKRIFEHFSDLSRFVGGLIKPTHAVMQHHLPTSARLVHSQVRNVKSGGRTIKVMMRDFVSLLNKDETGKATLSENGRKLLEGLRPEIFSRKQEEQS